MYGRSRVNVKVVYAPSSIHCLYVIYARKIYVRTHVKIMPQWKSTLTHYTTQVSCY